MHETLILHSAEEVAKKVAFDLDQEVTRLLSSQEEVHLVLTGGTVGNMALTALAELLVDKDLLGLKIWWGDERFVESTSPDRNANQASNALLSKISIQKSALHPFPSSDESDIKTAASSFARQIEQISPRFDIVLLGMGGDGHVASLFPGSETESVGDWVVVEENSPKPPSARLSLSYSALSTSQQVWFLVAGADKADAVASVFAGEDLPAGNVSGVELTRWYLDEAAASKTTS
jgi:6-phosphogluconolactonase